MGGSLPNARDPAACLGLLHDDFYHAERLSCFSEESGQWTPWLQQQCDHLCALAEQSGSALMTSNGFAEEHVRRSCVSAGIRCD